MDDDFVDAMDTRNTNARKNKRRRSQPNDKNVEHLETDSPDPKQSGSPTEDLIKSMATTNTEVKKFLDEKSSLLDPALVLLLMLNQVSSCALLLQQVATETTKRKYGQPRPFLILPKLSGSARLLDPASQKQRAPLLPLAQ